MYIIIQEYILSYEKTSVNTALACCVCFLCVFLFLFFLVLTVVHNFNSGFYGPDFFHQINFNHFFFSINREKAYIVFLFLFFVFLSNLRRKQVFFLRVFPWLFFSQGKPNQSKV